MEKKLRLVQVAREFKVGLGTITEFLEKKGINDVAPNTLVESDVYAMLEKEFGGNHLGGERDNVRERMSSIKQESVSLGNKKEQPQAEEQEVVIRSGSFIRTEVPQPKVLGKIDLEPKHQPKAEEPKPQPKVSEQPAAPKVAPAPKPQAEVKAAPAPKKEQPAPAPAKVEEKSPVANSEAQSKTYDERLAESTDVFRVDSTNLSGPKVLGKIDVDSLRKNAEPSHREKRKRIKDKVDVTKPQQGGGKPQHGGKPQQGGQQGGGNNQPMSKKDKKNKQKPAPKPVVRAEVSDEEVQKQIKDTLARLTSKGAKSKGSVYRKEKRQAAAERM